MIDEEPKRKTVHEAAKLVGELTMALQGSKHFTVEGSLNKIAGFLDVSVDAFVVKPAFNGTLMLPSIAMGMLTHWANLQPVKK